MKSVLVLNSFLENQLRRLVEKPDVNVPGYEFQVCSVSGKELQQMNVNFLQGKQRSRFLQEYKSETSYTLEDGHVGRNM
jgi:hypothetical protein